MKILRRFKNEEHEKVAKTLGEHEARISNMELRLKRLEREKGIFKPMPSELTEAK
jgi:ParB-like chromosome segregation protein Spo0J